MIQNKSNIIFLALRTSNYVKMSCNAAMSLGNDIIANKTLVTSVDLYELNKDLIHTYFNDVKFCDKDSDPGYIKVTLNEYTDYENNIYIDADSLASNVCNIDMLIDSIDVDFWINAYSIVNSAKPIWSHWGNYAKIKNLFELSGHIANGTQSSCFFFKKSETIDLFNTNKEVYNIINNNRDVLLNKWMKNFIPDELIWSISTNLVGYDPYIFSENLGQIGFIERMTRIDKKHYLYNYQLLTFPSGMYKLKQAIKTFYNELSMHHARKNNIRQFYKYKDKL